MSWPLSQDYNEAIQDPHNSFSDAELKTGEAVSNAMGIPMPRSGNFADVYEVRCPSGSRWAVKCFTREVFGLRERYAEISKYLRLAKLPFMVDFTYLEQGIRVRGQWYPILKMQWVEGFLLNEFVRDNLDKKPVLQALGQIWLRMAKRLRESYIAHCDLQHGNVLFVPGSTSSSLAVKLIDYDGMCVPSLVGTKSGEVGHPAYQHPERLRTGAYNQEVDRFSLLSIATALRCLAVGGRPLWERYDTGDNLLFRQADLQVPAESPLFRELLSISDPQAQMLVTELYRACQGPLDAVPLLTDLVPEEKPGNASRSQLSAKPQVAAVPTTPKPSAFQNIESRSSGRRSRREAVRDRSGTFIPWIAAGSVAACALVGGVLLWALHSPSPSEKSPTAPERQHALVDKSVPANRNEESQAPQPAERPLSVDPPANPIEDKPANPIGQGQNSDVRPGEKTEPERPPTEEPKYISIAAEEIVRLGDLNGEIRKNSPEYKSFGEKYNGKVVKLEGEATYFGHTPKLCDLHLLVTFLDEKAKDFRRAKIYVVVAMDGINDTFVKENDGALNQFRFLGTVTGVLQWHPNGMGIREAVLDLNKIKKESVPAAAKLPMPDEAALKSSTEEIHNTYKPEYASKDAADLAALAAKLLARGLKKNETPERRFVFLREAGDTAARVGDPLLSLRALEELAKLFAIEVLPLKTDALQEAVKNVRTRDTNKAVFESASALLSTAIRTDDYEDAERLVKTMEVAAFKVGVPRGLLRYAANEVQRLKRKYADIEAAVARLANEPNDAEANRIVGSFRCVEKGDWENGLPLVVKGDDAQLKTLAENDRAAPTTVDARAAVGDAWWMLAQQRAKGPTRANLEQRACFWYALALPESLTKSGVRMEKNLRRHNNDYPTLAWGHLDISQAVVTLGALRLNKDKQETKRIVTRGVFSGPIDIAVIARTEKNEIRLRAAKGGCVIFNWENKPEELRVHRPDGNLATAPLKPLLPNIWYLLSWRITEDDMTVSVNGRAVFAEKHRYDLAEKYPVSINTYGSDIEVLSFTVNPISKESR